MDESEAKRRALDFVSQSDIDPWVFESIRRIPRSEMEVPTTVGDEWVVILNFIPAEDVLDDSPGFAIITVDDATGEATFFPTL